ncbi:MAG: hypothetical protein ACXVAX_01370 [Pseudobdellovibrio sp.]
MKKLTRKIVFLIAAISLVGCDKGGSNFSILSVSSQFQQTATFTPRKLDVLFVTDNSGSMQASQSNLATNFPSFINYFKDKGYDFKIAVTTTDAYYGDQFVTSSCSLCNVQQTQFRSGVNPPVRVIDSTMANIESIFSQNVSVGTSGSGDERAFSSFKAALNSSLNAGFHRSDAFLAIVIVSDSDDFSHDDININESYTQPTLHPVSTYVDYLKTFTGGQPTTDFSVATIGVLDTTCRDQLHSEMKIGVRYMNLSDLTGGAKNSICDPFTTVLDNINATIASQLQAQFQLTRTPVVSSIRVIIDGVLVPQDATNGWSYDSTTNIISVKGSYSPKSGASVTINFDPSISG